MAVSYTHLDVYKRQLQKTDMLSKFEPTYRPVVELEQKISETRAAIALSLIHI